MFTGPTGWAELRNWPGDWQACNESRRTRKSSNLISLFYTNLRTATNGTHPRPAPAMGPGTEAEAGTNAISAVVLALPTVTP